MTLSSDDVEDAIEQLRGMGAATEVHGDGRVIRYRHYLKDWLGVDGTELAVMTELLLRGDQTVGELRGRAARMASNQLPDMSSLKPVLESLAQKKLLVSLTAEGRGQVVTHALFSDDELDHIKQKYAGGNATNAARTSSDGPAASARPRAGTDRDAEDSSSELAAIKQELASLTEQVAKMSKEIEDIWGNIGG